MDFCVNGATAGAGEALAIDTKIHLLYTVGSRKVLFYGIGIWVCMNFYILFFGLIMKT